MTTITLNCFLSGDDDPFDSDSTFQVEIDNTKHVTCLKEYIKDKIYPKFENVSITDIKLWKVNISQDNETTIKGNSVKEFLKDGEKLTPISKVCEYFPNQPDDKRIHLIIQGK